MIFQHIWEDIIILIYPKIIKEINTVLVSFQVQIFCYFLPSTVANSYNLFPLIFPFDTMHLPE